MYEILAAKLVARVGRSVVLPDRAAKVGFPIVGLPSVPAGTPDVVIAIRIVLGLAGLENQGCSSEVWFTTRSMTSLMPRLSVKSRRSLWLGEGSRPSAALRFFRSQVVERAAVAEPRDATAARYSAVPMPFHAAIACARGSSET
jgi:hypothetical protein